MIAPEAAPFVGHFAVAAGPDGSRLCDGVLGGPADQKFTIRTPAGPQMVVASRGSGAFLHQVQHITVAVSGRLDDGPGSGATPLRGDAFAQWAAERWGRLGMDDLDRWIGDWALAVVDSRSGLFLTARDLCGARPAFVAAVNGLPVVGTRYSGICDVPGLLLDPDPSFVVGNLVGRPLDATTTAYRSIAAVAPGFAATWAQGSWRQRRALHWRLPDRRSTSDAAVAEEVSTILDRAVRDRVDGSTRPAVALSGGIDSGIVAMLLARRRTDVSAVMLAFSDAGGDERDRQETLCSALGMSPVWVDPMTYEVMGREGPDATIQRDRRIFPTTNWFLSEAMADGVGLAGADVLFTGEDADSAFAHHPPAELAELIGRGRPWMAWRLLSEMHRNRRISRRGLLEAAAFWLVPMSVRRRAQWSRGVFLPPCPVTQEVLDASRVREHLSADGTLSGWRPRHSFALARSASISATTLNDNGLTLGHFLETVGAVPSNPFNDRRLLSVSAALRPHHLTDGRRDKHVLRLVHTALAPSGYRPQTIKAVLSAPARRSALGAQREYVLDGLRVAIRRDDWFDIPAVSRMYADAAAGGYDVVALQVARTALWIDHVTTSRWTGPAS